MKKNMYSDLKHMQLQARVVTDCILNELDNRWYECSREARALKVARNNNEDEYLRDSYVFKTRMDAYLCVKTLVSSALSENTISSNIKPRGDYSPIPMQKQTFDIIESLETKIDRLIMLRNFEAKKDDKVSFMDKEYILALEDAKKIIKETIVELCV